MIEKSKILEAWIMVEHLSEGDIRLNDKSLLALDDLQEGDFYTLFQREMEKKKFKPKQKGGIVLYCDIFNFREVVSLLREKYRLEPTDEDIKFGSKFSFALYFDRNFNFLADMMFFTESAYIRYHQEVPQLEEFQEFEDELKQKLTQDFEETAAAPEKFNEAVQKALRRCGTEVDVKNCRIQVLNNVETEGTNLHSFFIQDLEKAKDIETDNLHAYLYGGQGDRVNLDSKKGSERFHPQAFEEILQPKNYPLGRFPSNTQYALSLMQQVAVNLSIGLDPQPVRSVNGPPGTGKTTLLKDIFAQLVVQQAYDIARLPDHCIKAQETPDTSKRDAIGVLPERIAENSIVVASSNNGAVQNIVNELPLCQGIDEALLEELKEADYFRALSNAKVSAQWKENENGTWTEELTCEAGQGEEQFWGVFSLEGGKSDNMTNILTHIKHIYKYLEDEYLPPEEDLYGEFLKQYEAVRALRTRAQTAADSVQPRQDCLQKLERERASYQKEAAQREAALALALGKLEESGREAEERLDQVRQRLEAVQVRKEKVSKNQDNLEQCLELYRAQVPGPSADQREKDDYRARLNQLADRILQSQDEDAACDRQEGELRRELARIQGEQRQSGAKEAALQKELADWKQAEEGRLSVLQQKAQGYETLQGGKPLDMDLAYDALQLSNPWFGEAYRVAQSKLFLTALRVRKQFLFENRRHLWSAALIWNQQEKYADRKPLIEAAWSWINLTIPVISSTFASFSRMCRHLGADTLGHLFIDEAGQALPQAAVGAVYRSRHVMVVGDPSQIKPVLTLDSNTLRMLSKHFGVTETYLSASASAQTLVDAASRYGFYRNKDEDSWIGIPLWVHRRCQYPMFTISNKISYDGFMVQGMEKYGKTGWYDIGGKANNKYVEEQGEFLLRKIQELMEKNPKIADRKEKDEIYVITPFSNVAYQLAQKLRKIRFTRYDAQGKPTNVGTVHTFQGKEAPIVFFVLGADQQSNGAAKWAVDEPNMMNVAATRAKKEFYIVGDRKLYLGLHCEVATETNRIIMQYKKNHPELVEDTVAPPVAKAAPAPAKKAQPARSAPVPMAASPAPAAKAPAPAAGTPAADPPAPAAEAPAAPAAARPQRVMGTVRYVGKGPRSSYAYVSGEDGKDYSISESIFAKTERAEEVIQKDKRISFVPKAGPKRLLATDVRPEAQRER